MCAYCCKHNPKPSVDVRVYEDASDVIPEDTPDRSRHTIVQTLMVRELGSGIFHINSVFSRILDHPHGDQVFPLSGVG